MLETHHSMCMQPSQNVCDECKENYSLYGTYESHSQTLIKLHARLLAFQLWALNAGLHIGKKLLNTKASLIGRCAGVLD